MGGWEGGKGECVTCVKVVESGKCDYELVGSVRCEVVQLVRVDENGRCDCV